MSKISENDAWKAMDSYRPDQALEIWNQLISSEKKEQARDNFN